MTTREAERNRELCKISIMVNSRRYLSVLEELRNFWQGDKMTLGNCIDFLQGVVAGQEDAARLGLTSGRQTDLTQAEWEAEQSRNVKSPAEPVAKLRKKPGPKPGSKPGKKKIGRARKVVQK